MNKHILTAAYKFAGSQAGLAKVLGVKPSVVNQWINHTRPVPAKACVAIEKYTQGAVRRQDLRPDDAHELWPDIAAPQKVDAPPPEIPQNLQKAAKELLNTGRFSLDDDAINWFFILPNDKKEELARTQSFITARMCRALLPKQSIHGGETK